VIGLPILSGEGGLTETDLMMVGELDAPGVGWPPIPPMPPPRASSA